MPGEPKKKRYKGKSTSGKVREPIKIVKAKRKDLNLDETISTLEAKRRKRIRKLPEVTVWGKRKKKKITHRPMYDR